jgi:hypothetical protein
LPKIEHVAHIGGRRTPKEYSMGQTAREWTIVIAAAATLVACEHPVEPQRSAVSAPTPGINAAAASSVATADPSLPSAVVALQPKVAPQPKTDDGLLSSAAKTDVGAQERDQKMPLPGQANDHSTPDFAKRVNAKPAS